MLKSLEPKNYLASKKFTGSYETRPEVSEGGPAITNLIQGVASEEADNHRQIEVTMDLPL